VKTESLRERLIDDHGAFGGQVSVPGATQTPT
jgi:hypothetical protein